MAFLNVIEIRAPRRVGLFFECRVLEKLKDVGRASTFIICMKTNHMEYVILKNTSNAPVGSYSLINRNKLGPYL